MISDVWEVRMFWSRSAASVLIVASIVPTRPVAGQVIVSQVGVATGATMPTGAYHTGSLGGFNVGRERRSERRAAIVLPSKTVPPWWDRGVPHHDLHD